MRRPVSVSAFAAALLAALAACASRAPTPRAATAAAPPDPGPSARDPRSLAAAGYASVVCAAVFLQGRDPAEAGRDSTYFVVNDADRAAADPVQVDRTRGEVRVSVRGGPTRVARLAGGSGCVTLPEGSERTPRLAPAPQTALASAADAPWPMGDGPPAEPRASGEERRAMADAIAPWFEDPAALTTAVIVVHRGEIVAERYGQGAARDTLLDASAIGKSVLATIAGVAARQGLVRLDTSPALPEWSRPGDPRASIALLDLLRMSSGLACTSPFDDGWDETKGYTDSQYVYTGAEDAVAYAIARPLAKPPRSEGRYANCDPLAALGALERALAARGDTLGAFAQRELYDRIGIRRMVTEPDPAGHPLFIGYHYATARDLARLGLLYARGGEWLGARILPEGFARTVTTPAPAWKEGEYGAGFWLSPALGPSVPADAFAMVGFRGQSVTVVPSLELVVVRLGHPRGSEGSGKARARALPAILAAAR